jgi:RNA polymerase sigma-70 factor (ECF subfamily)
VNQPDEFAPFMRTAWPGLMRYLHGMQATKDEAEDAAQYALTEAYAAWSRIEYPHAWVRVAARRRFESIRQADRRSQERLEAHAVDLGPAAARSAETNALRGQDARLLIGRLPPRQAAVFALHLDGYKIAEIAHKLQLSESTARSHLRHARHRLREQLTADGAAEGGVS